MNGYAAWKSKSAKHIREISRKVIDSVSSALTRERDRLVTTQPLPLSPSPPSPTETFPAASNPTALPENILCSQGDKQSQASRHIWEVITNPNKCKNHSLVAAYLADEGIESADELRVIAAVPEMVDQLCAMLKTAWGKSVRESFSQLKQEGGR